MFPNPTCMETGFKQTFPNKNFRNHTERLTNI
jgi:hypothetical protein